MQIEQLIEELLEIKKQHGNIEVTCTGSTLQDDGLDVFETTVEALVVNEKHPVHGKAVRLWL